MNISSKKTFIVFMIFLLFINCIISHINAQSSQDYAIPGKISFNYYEDPVKCANCHGMAMMNHSMKLRQWQSSQHSRAWTGDFFSHQYFDLARPDGDLDKKVEGIKVGCVGCHSPSTYMSMGETLLNTLPPKPQAIENEWNMISPIKSNADRGVFCDFCHTLSSVDIPPVDFNYKSSATAGIDPKRGPFRMMQGGMMMSSHDMIFSNLHNSPMICGTCHDEINPFNKKVKGTYTEWLDSPYAPDTRCQDCHQKNDGMGGMMQMYSMNFKGGFSPWVEGVASIKIDAPENASSNYALNFNITIVNEKVGHEFPSGSEEERQLWIHVTAVDENGKSWDIPFTTQPNLTDPENPKHIYWVTTNSEVAWPSPNSKNSKPISRDGITEGDKIYHSVFLSPEYNGSKITYAQYYASNIFSNRLKPLEPKTESYSWQIPKEAEGSLTLRAELNYRRMPDSMADYFGIMKRPTILVNSALAVVSLR